MNNSTTSGNLLITRFLSLLTLFLFLSTFSFSVVAEVGKPLSAKDLDALLIKQTGSRHIIKETKNGAHIFCPTQALEAEISKDEFKLFSKSSKAPGSFSFKVSNFGKGSVRNRTSLDNAQISTTSKIVTVKGDNLTQEFSTKYNGIRQDFIINSRPIGNKDLSLDLELYNAAAELHERGVKITMKGGREFIYGQLLVTDATGKKLIAQFNVHAKDKLSIQVNDKDAHYPVRIDPTIVDSSWSEIAGGVSGDSSKVYCAAVDGADVLYIGGDFTKAGDSGNTRFLAQWDGFGWSSVGRGVNNVVYAMAVDANNNLYVGGAFTKAGNDKVGDLVVNHFAKWGTDPTLKPSSGWSSTKWRALGEGTDAAVYAISADDDLNNAHSVYLGGKFTTPGNHVAKWKYTYAGAPTFTYTAAYEELASGVGEVDTYVYAIAVDGDAGAGSVYVGGNFESAWDGESIPDTGLLARWTIDNSTTPPTWEWESIGAATGKSVNALAVDSAQVLYVGGDFSSIGAAAAGNFARFAGGWTSAAGDPGEITSLAIDSANKVYAGGEWGIKSSALGTTAPWVDMAIGAGAEVYAIAVDSTDLIYGAGILTRTLPVYNDPLAADTEARNVAVFNAVTPAWEALQQVDNMSNPMGMGGVGPDYNNNVNAVASYCGNGPGFVDPKGGIYVGGAFTRVGAFPNAISANYVAKWDEDKQEWSALADDDDDPKLFNGVNGEVGALVYEGGILYAGGAFTMAGTVDAMHMAKFWDDPSDDPDVGGHWSDMGDVLTSTEEDGGYDFVEDIPVVITAMTADSESPANIYAGGSFETPGKYVAKFAAGGTGSALGAGVGAALDPTPFVYALTCDSENNLYIGGGFTEPGGYLTKWNGSAYEDLGAGFDKTVWALGMDRNDMLYVGGSFTTFVGGQPYIAKFDTLNPTWSALGPELNGPVFDIDTDSANFVYAVGDFSFTTADGDVCNNIAQWQPESASWQPVGSGVGGGKPNQQVWAISYNDSAGRLYVGGAFDEFKSIPGPETAVNRIASCKLHYLIQFEIAPYYGSNPVEYKGTFSPGTWAAGDYLAGDFVYSTPAFDPDNQYRFKCIQGGTTGGTEPTWDTFDGAITDDGVAPTLVKWEREANVANMDVRNSRSVWQYVLSGGMCKSITAVPDPIENTGGVEYFLSNWTGRRDVGKCGGTPCISPSRLNPYTYTGTGSPDFILASATITAHFGKMIYVNQDSESLNPTGNSWTDAYTDFQDALERAQPFDMIWVAEGTYYPGTTVDATFKLQKFLRVYGGFDGTETLTWAQKRNSAQLFDMLDAREIAKNRTTLSGDFSDKSGSDYTDDPSKNNSLHIVTGPGFEYDGTQASIDAASDADKVEYRIRTLLSGFTLEGGYAAGDGVLEDRGGAVMLKSIATILDQCTLKNNFATQAGGAVYMQKTYIDTLPCAWTNLCPTTTLNLVVKNPHVITNCAFLNNSANTGGAIAAIDTNIRVYRTTFGVNTADIGGAIALDGYPWTPAPNATKHCAYSVFRSCIFYDNHSGDINSYDNISLRNGAQTEISYTNIVEPRAGAGYIYPGIGNYAEDPIYVSSGSSALWAATTYYKFGDVINVGALKNKYVCISQGTSAGVEPDWTTVPNIGDTISDGTITWQRQAWDNTIDLHLQSSAGHFTTNGWVYDNYTSPSIDKGINYDITTGIGAYGLEPLPSGFRLNMGAYGNTFEASKSWDVLPVPANPAIVVTQPNSSNSGKQGLIFGIAGAEYEIKCLSQGGAPSGAGIELTLYKTDTVGVIGVIDATQVGAPVEDPPASGRYISTFTWAINTDDIDGNPPNLAFGDDYYIVATNFGNITQSPDPGSLFTINRSYDVTFRIDDVAAHPNAEIRDAAATPQAVPFTLPYISGDNTDPFTAFTLASDLYQFVNWTWMDPVTNNQITTTDKTLTIKVNGTITVTANFAGTNVLTVVNGTPEDPVPVELYENEIQQVVADTAPAGQHFLEWTTSAGGTFDDATGWVAGTAYGGAGEPLNVSNATGTYIFECTTAGISGPGPLEPTWNVDDPISGLTTTDGTAVWTQVVGASTSNNETATFTMPGNATTVTAVYAANATHNLTVSLGVPLGPTPVPEYGTQLITADDRSGAFHEHFTNWTNGDYWAHNTVYNVNDFVTSTDGQYFMICSTAGTSALLPANEPDWSLVAVDTTVVDGTVTWMRITNPFADRLATPTTYTMGVYTPAGITVPVFAKFAGNSSYGMTFAVTLESAPADSGHAAIPGPDAGDYYAYEPYNILGDNPNAGTMYFVEWTSSAGGTFADANSENTTFTMPNNAVELTATYALKPTLVVDNGTGDGSHDGGEVVAITPTGDLAIPGGIFVNWTITSGGGAFNDATARAAQAYVVGDYVSSSDGKYRFQCITAGTTVGGEPVWITDIPITGETTDDLPVVWTQVDLTTTSSVAVSRYIMPSGNATIIANYSADPTLTVVRGTEDGEYGAGTVTIITADGPAGGEYFTGWTQTPTTPGVNGTLHEDIWFAATAYIVGDYVTNGGFRFICTTAGTSKVAPAPVWNVDAPITGLTTTDNTVVWTQVELTQKSPMNFTMPANSITVTANFTLNPSLTVVDGTLSNPSIAPNTSTNIAANADSAADGYFVDWSDDVGGAFGDVNARETTYIIGTVNAEVTANFSDDPTLTVVAGNDVTEGGTPAEHPIGTVVDITANNPTGTMTFNGWTTSDGGSFGLASSWSANVVYALDDFVRSTSGYSFQCTTAGTAGAAEPVWNVDDPISGLTTAEGPDTLVWTQVNHATYTMPANKATVTANWAWIVTFDVLLATDGTISGTTPQNIADGEDCTEVTAVPRPGKAFVNWTDAFAAVLGVLPDLTVTNVTADMDITANFGDDPNWTGNITYGSMFSVRPAFDAGPPIQPGFATLGENEFLYRPTVYGTYVDTITGRTIKATTRATNRVSTSYITDIYKTEWSRMVCLYNKRALATANRAATTTESWLASNPINGFKCTMSGRARSKNGTIDNTANLDGVGSGNYRLIAAPIITSVEGWDGVAVPVGVHNKSVIIVKGLYFGTKLPTAYFEYTIAGIGTLPDKIKQVRLKVQRVYAYASSKGVANKSCMDVDITSGTYGESQVNIEMPRLWWSGWGARTSYSLILNNKIGLDTVDIPVQPSGSNSNPDAVLDGDPVGDPTSKWITLQAGESSYILDVLANDTDTEADKLTITLPGGLISLKGARLAITKDKIRYTPPRDIFAQMAVLSLNAPPLDIFEDVFSYEVNDGQGGTSTTTVTVKIKPITIPTILKWDGLNALTDVKGRSLVILQGTNFGTRIPIVTMEYTDAVTLRVYSKRLRVVGVPKFANYKGIANKSYTDLDPDSGTFEESEVMVELPAAFNPQAPGVHFKITNKFTSFDDVGNDYVLGPANTLVAQDDDFTGVGSPALVSGEFTKANYYVLDVLANNGSGVDTSNNSGKLKIVPVLRTTTQGGRVVVDAKTNTIKYYRPVGVIGAIVGDTFTYYLQDYSDRTNTSNTVTVTIDVNLN